MRTRQLKHNNIPLKADITLPKLLVVMITVLTLVVIPIQYVNYRKVQAENPRASVAASDQTNQVTASADTGRVAGVITNESNNAKQTVAYYNLPILDTQLNKKSAPFLFLGAFLMILAAMVLIYMLSRTEPAYREIDRY